jgi:hypothetical protein
MKTFLFARGTLTPPQNRKRSGSRQDTLHARARSVRPPLYLFLFLFLAYPSSFLPPSALTDKMVEKFERLSLTQLSRFERHDFALFVTDVEASLLGRHPLESDSRRVNDAAEAKRASVVTPLPFATRPASVGGGSLFDLALIDPALMNKKFEFHMLFPSK